MILRKGGGTSLVVQWLGLCIPSAGGPGSFPGRGTRSHMPQLKSLHVATKPRHRQINKYFKKKRKKKRWQEYTELYKKDLQDPGDHAGVITHLEPGILECEV